ncbi:MAG TPA: PTS system mannose/fructose/sorbose family transporter subunit IID [Longimicrobiaceae bacterium]|nr:PTS system mannose/fructose/sorbose family transporter subunit IID [Longimicrobiaceae bacterium]
MNHLPRSLQARVILRSFLVQGSWNYETLLGTGFAFTMLPVLRYLYPEDGAALRAAVARHTTVFNCHPYLATVALGAVTRLETEAVDPSMVERFKSALRSSLGSLGDQLVWGAWRPASALLGVVLVLTGLAWWVGVLVFLVVYNLLHLGLRIWGWRVGTHSGLEVGRALRDLPLQPLARRTADVGAVLGGAALVLAAAPAAPDPDGLAVVALAAALGFLLGSRTRKLFAGVVGAVWILAIFSGWIR